MKLGILGLLVLVLSIAANAEVVGPDHLGDSFLIAAHGFGWSCSSAIDDRTNVYRQMEQQVINRCRNLGGTLAYSQRNYRPSVTGCYTFITLGFLTRYHSIIYQYGYCRRPATPPRPLARDIAIPNYQTSVIGGPVGGAVGTSSVSQRQYQPASTSAVTLSQEEREEIAQQQWELRLQAAQALEEERTRHAGEVFNKIRDLQEQIVDKIR